MLHRYFVIGAAVAMLCATFGAVGGEAASRARVQRAGAEDSGLAGIHTWRRYGGRTCFADHSHDASGSGANRRQAEAAAIRGWIDFTALEYGNAWARYNLAVGKSMRCDGGGASWSCSLEATPCRAY